MHTLPVTFESYRTLLSDQSFSVKQRSFGRRDLAFAGLSPPLEESLTSRRSPHLRK